ncbi:MAG: transporter substrate-binding domain-containing protein [Cyanobacterium sp. T60_A2020_053]|nr:transporter substrate-binding domain-containing protein [Cyanobacterium sp. T60_A2020_053]
MKYQLLGKNIGNKLNIKIAVLSFLTKNLLIKSISITSALLLLSQLPVNAQNILKEIENTGILKVGIADNAIPFGYRDDNQELRGICLEFVKLIQKNLTVILNRQSITTQVYVSNLKNRFQLVNDGVVYLECGANTIREIEGYNVTFSDPFFITGLQFLTKKNQVNNINSTNNNLRLGALNNTTTADYLSQQFSQANLRLFDGANGAKQGGRALENNRIDAFASDGILLVGIALSLNLPLNGEYEIVPKIPLTCEKYGVILPANDPLWNDFINQIIMSVEPENIMGAWLNFAEDSVKESPDCSL